jgi:class 3 adenylate cyclase/tetratricopeptide (TPR) repeat protein
MKCPRCQQENREGARFCRECGATFGVACLACGAKVDAGSKFCDGCGAALGATPPPPAPTPSRFATAESYTPKHLAEKILTSKSALEGERKQVTVLFADLKGSMELLADRDPEEARKLLDPVLEHMMEAVHRFEGTVNQVMGDGIMALFGAPLAHEDHAVRACYAALRMQQSVKQYADGVFRAYGVPVQIRVGLNSGEVVVRSIGSDLHMDYTAVGQTTHLAARMEQMATPGTILLAPDTLALAEGFVQLAARGPVAVKGLAEPVEVFELMGVSAARSRLHAAAARGLSRFVGRDAEMEALHRALDHAKQGRGQLVAIVGEPGVGKSRLVFELTHSHRVAGWTVLEAGSVSYGKATSYLPVIDLLKGYVKVGERDTPRDVREKVLGKVLALDRALEPTLPALLTLLDVPVDDGAWQALDPPRRRQHMLDAVKRLLLREAQGQPTVVVFEDLHWVDPETQALLESLVDSLPTARLLLLVNYRPEYTHGWGSKTYYTQLRLDALSAEGAGELLEALLGADSTVAPLARLLVGRTGGNPLFLEESVRALVETGILVGARGRYRLAQPIEAVRVPATVQAILAARIDRLPPDDKRLLETAAVIGKDVPFALLQAIAGTGEEDLRRGLGRLQGAELLYEASLFPDLEYTFKHALTHEVAYEGVLHERRRDLHAQIVVAIEHLHAGRLEEQTERLAHHALRGERWEEAVRYGRQASQRAIGRNAFAAAARGLDAALTALSHWPQGRETLVLEWELTSQLGHCLGPLGQLDRCRTVYERALSMAETLGDPGRLVEAMSYLAGAHWRLGDAVGAVALGERAVAVADTGDDAARLALARRQLAMACHSTGAFYRAIALLEQARPVLLNPAAVTGSGAQAGVLVATWLARCLAAVGEFDRARMVASEGAGLAATSDTALNRLTAAWGLVTLAVSRGDFARAIPVLEQGVTLAEAADIRVWSSGFVAFLGYAYAHSGRPGEGVRLLEDAIVLAEARNRVARAEFVSLLSEAHLLAGRPRDAMATAQQGLAGTRERGERGDEARTLRALAEATARIDPPDVHAAVAYYHQALTLGDELGMRPTVAHCHAGLARLYRRMGERERADEHLTLATTMYREMGMTYWLEKLERAWATT